jgi:hypothetical protein
MIEKKLVHEQWYNGPEQDFSIGVGMKFNMAAISSQ